MSLANSPRPLELTAAFLEWFNATALLDGPDGPGEPVTIGDAFYDLTPAQADRLRGLLGVDASIIRAHSASVAPE